MLRIMPSTRTPCRQSVDGSFCCVLHDATTATHKHAAIGGTHTRLPALFTTAEGQELPRVLDKVLAARMMALVEAVTCDHSPRAQHERDQFLDLFLDSSLCMCKCSASLLACVQRCLLAASTSLYPHTLLG